MSGIRVHHVGMRGGLAGLPLGPARAVDVGRPLALAAGPNLYAAAEPGEPAEARPVHAPGLAHVCVQALDGGAARRELEQAGASFLSPPTALGTGYLYAYGHDAAGRLLELETAPFLPAEPPVWFGHVAFVSPDAERLARFYAGLLDATLGTSGRLRDNARVDAVAGLAGIDVEAWWARGDGFTVEVWRYHTPPAPIVESARWYPHLGLEVDALEPALARVSALGGDAGAIATGPDGRSAPARDPDGNALLLVEWAGPALAVAALPHRDILARVAARQGR